MIGTRFPSAAILVSFLAVIALLGAACGSDLTTTADSTTSTPATTTSTPATTTTAAPSTTAPATTATPTTATPTTVATTTTDTAPTSTEPPETTLPGEPFDLFIEPGDVLGVVGVQYDDLLNIRRAPGTDQDILAGAGPLADDLVATGRERLLSSSIWYEVTTGDVTGWASAAFLAYLGGVDDATAEWQAENTIGEIETMVEMGETIAATFASTDPQSSIVRSDAGGVGDLGEITYDVIGLGDDAQTGWRLHIFGTPSESGEGFFLKSIERTVLCTRGLSGEICV